MGSSAPSGVLLPFVSVSIAVFALLIAFLTYRISTRRHLTESLLRIADRLERQDKRDLRRVLYSLDRLAHGGWPADLREQIHAWGAELDILSLIVSAKEIDQRAFFYLYGDVLIRSIYLLAPYVNAERQTRGRQFMQPLGGLIPMLIAQWRRECRQHNYPDEIGLPGAPGRLTLEAFQEDEACRRLRLETRGGPRRMIALFLFR